jgi:hypothetical protein
MNRIVAIGKTEISERHLSKVLGFTLNLNYFLRLDILQHMWCWERIKSRDAGSSVWAGSGLQYTRP